MSVRDSERRAVLTIAAGALGISVLGETWGTPLVAETQGESGYASLQQAYDALPTTGGTVLVPNGYTESLTRDLRLTKPNCGFLFLGSALISLGACRLRFERSAHNGFIRSLAQAGNRFGEITAPFDEVTAFGARFDYRGRGGPDGHAAIEIGDGSGTIEGVCLEGLCIRTDEAARHAWGVIARQTTFARFDRLTVSNAGAGTPGWEMGGIRLVGTGGGDGYCGYVEILSPRISGGRVGIETVGQVNHCVMVGGTLNGTATGAGRTIGLLRGGNGSGFVVLNTEIASWSECLHLGEGVAQDSYTIRTESDAQNAFDVVIARGASRNVVRVIGGSAPGGGLSKRDDNEPATGNDVCLIGDQAPRNITLPQGGIVGERVAAGETRSLIGSRRTGWSKPGGQASRAAFDPATVTTEELARRVKALIDDLAQHGLIGP